jgi:hypothetical protein
MRSRSGRGATTSIEMLRFARLQRHLMLTIAAAAAVWALGAPVAGRVLYPTPAQQPHGATKLLFYCHLS